MSLDVIMMTPPEANPNTSPKAASANGPLCSGHNSPTVKSTTETASNSPSVGRVDSISDQGRRTATATPFSPIEHPYAPTQPPVTHSHPQETVDGLVGLGRSQRISPLTASFSAINVTTPADGPIGPKNSYVRTSSEHSLSQDQSFRSQGSSESSPVTLQPIRLAPRSLDTNGSTSNVRGRQHPDLETAEPSQGHFKVRHSDHVMPDTPQSPRESAHRYQPYPTQGSVHHAPTSATRSPHGRVLKRKLEPQRVHLPEPHQPQAPRGRRIMASEPYRAHADTPRQSIDHQSGPKIMCRADTSSTVADGFKVLRGAIPNRLAIAAAEVLDQGMEQVRAAPTHKSFGLSLQAYQIRDEFMRHVSSFSSLVFYGLCPMSVVLRKIFWCPLHCIISWPLLQTTTEVY